MSYLLFLAFIFGFLKFLIIINFHLPPIKDTDVATGHAGSSFSYYETRKKSILVNIELYNVDEQIKNHFY